MRIIVIDGQGGGIGTAGLLREEVEHLVEFERFHMSVHGFLQYSVRFAPRRKGCRPSAPGFSNDS